MARPDERTVTAPVSGKRVRLPVASGVLNGREVFFFNASINHLLAYDLQLGGVVDGCVETYLAKGRAGRFERRTITRIEDEFTGQQPPQRAVA